jgi:hypothetical protein
MYFSKRLIRPSIVGLSHLTIGLTLREYFVKWQAICIIITKIDQMTLNIEYLDILCKSLKE